MTGPGVRRSKRPLFASRTHCNVLWKHSKFGNKVKIGKKVQLGNKFANWCNVWSIEDVTVYGHVSECHVTFGRELLHNDYEIPISTIKFPEGRFKRSLTYPCQRSLDESRATYNKTFKRVANPGIPYELWDKNAIGWRSWNIASQEWKVCGMDVEIAMFVVKGSAHLTAPPDRSKEICCSPSCLWSQAQRGTSDPDNYQNMGYWLTIHHWCIYMWSWTEMLILSFQLRAKTVWIPLRTSIEICRLGEGQIFCPDYLLENLSPKDHENVID